MGEVAAASDPDALWTLLWPMLMATPRVMAAVTVAPLFPASLFPGLLRNTLAVSLALCLYPHIAAHMPGPELTAAAWIALIGKEIFLGMLIGLAVGTLVWVLESAGSIIDLQIGWSNNMIFDPFGGHESAIMASFMSRLAVALFVVGGGLYVFVTLLYESYQLWPLASFHPVIDGRLLDFSTGALGSIAQSIVRVAAPVVLLLVLIDLGFGLINRVVPQLNVFFFTMPLKAAAAALMIAIYLSYLADIVVAEMSDLRQFLERVAPVLQPPGPISHGR